KAHENTSQPTLIEIKTVIGFGSPNKSASSASHGAPLGEEEAILTKANYKWPHEAFEVPEEVYTDFKTKILDQGAKKEAAWNELLEKYNDEYPDLAKEFKQVMENELPEGWDSSLPQYKFGEDKLATRVASSEVINALSNSVPQLFGGSADLASSNNTMMKEEDDYTADHYAGRNIWFGVREFAMGAALNGLALHGGLKPYGGTFFVFSDYMRGAIRLSAIMNAPVTYVFTHDSIAVGEDGPTHEPVEQLPSLRAIPNLSVIRPADGNETQAAWRLAMEATNKPTTLVLTRQSLPTITKDAEETYENVKKGAYVISPNENAEAILIATGSEVQLAIAAQEELTTKGINVSVVSMPSWDLFEAQPTAYKETVLPKDITKRVAIEMANPLGWERFVGLEGTIIGIDTFGASAPGNKVVEAYGFNVENVVKQVENTIK